jgi:hypothetical protein
MSASVGKLAQWCFNQLGVCMIIDRQPPHCQRENIQRESSGSNSMRKGIRTIVAMLGLMKVSIENSECERKDTYIAASARIPATAYLVR